MVGSRGAGAEEEAAAVLASVTEKAVVASQRLAAEEAATARMVWQATGGAEEEEAAVLASAERWAFFWSLETRRSRRPRWRHAVHAAPPPARCTVPPVQPPRVGGSVGLLTPNRGVAGGT